MRNFNQPAGSTIGKIAECRLSFLSLSGFIRRVRFGSQFRSVFMLKFPVTKVVILLTVEIRVLLIFLITSSIVSLKKMNLINIPVLRLHCGKTESLFSSLKFCSKSKSFNASMKGLSGASDILTKLNFLHT